MSKQIWPIDAVGNTIRKGDPVMVELLKARAIFRVQDIEPAAMLLDPSNKTLIPTFGKLRIVAVVEIQFSPEEPIGNIFALKTPDEVIIPQGGLTQ